MVKLFKIQNFDKNFFLEKRFIFQHAGPGGGPKTGPAKTAPKVAVAPAQAATKAASGQALNHLSATISGLPKQAEVKVALEKIAVNQTLTLSQIDNSNLKQELLDYFAQAIDAQRLELEKIPYVKANFEAFKNSAVVMMQLSASSAIQKEKKLVQDFKAANQGVDISGIEFQLDSKGAFHTLDLGVTILVPSVIQAQFAQFKSAQAAQKTAKLANAPKPIEITRENLIARIKMILPGPLGLLAGFFFKKKKGDPPDFLDALIKSPGENKEILALLKMPGYEDVNPLESLEGTAFAAAANQMLDKMSNGKNFDLTDDPVKSLNLTKFMGLQDATKGIRAKEQLLISYHSSQGKPSNEALVLKEGPGVVIPGGMKYQIVGDPQERFAKKNTKIEAEPGKPVKILFAEQLAIHSGAQFTVETL